MQADIPATKPAELSILPARMEIVFSDNAENPLSLVSEPVDDLAEMAELARTSFSLKEKVALDLGGSTVSRNELTLLLRKSARFSSSPTYLNRLANLFKAVGDFGREHETLVSALQFSDLPLFHEKLGENFLRGNRLNEARDLFGHLADSGSSHGNLRMAAFCVGEKDFDGASRFVEKSVAINPAGYAERLFQGALCLIRQNYSSAIGYFRIALSDRPNSTNLYCNLGLAYLGEGRVDKAFDSLKRSVALDPFNAAALVILADVASKLGKDSDVINSLRYFVEFEQKNASVWGRTARALLTIGATDECIQALKYQGALAEKSYVWNNLGVAYGKSRNFNQSIESFKKALSLSTEHDADEYLLIYRNILQAYFSAGMYRQVAVLTPDLIKQFDLRKIVASTTGSDVFFFYIRALDETNRKSDGRQLSEALLYVEGISDSLKTWLVSGLIADYGLSRANDEVLSRLLEKYQELASSPHRDNASNFRNNLAFGFAELGMLDEAERCFAPLSVKNHRDPYVTATAGLIQFRRGNFSRGEDLYREAIALANGRAAKTKIRQKLQLELARSVRTSDILRRRALLERVINEKGGDRLLRAQATRKLALLLERDRLK